ncbi:MAG: sodium-dependent phosphate transporter, partial [Pseudomonas stutzeri]|nr:sodium-dependent phosphate transporter [Xanthomonadales bacterium]NIN78903.1 sodium-dependent phosphate transporter [Stutzerimonas stutzeri]NIO13066.1 sodium-dependent phosphate transporter [Xanthomonadales bacterium]NIS54930.1 sodium-dependent phosphate transporter [Stutzerimonas stutzeri]
KHWGSVILGFGLLFFGLSLMKDAFGPLRHSAQAQAVVVRLAGNPLTGVLVGTIMTMVVQSSSATIAVAQMLAFNGVLTFPQALPLILGDNIGTT